MDKKQECRIARAKSIRYIEIEIFHINLRERYAFSSEIHRTQNLPSKGVYLLKKTDKVKTVHCS